MLHLLRRQPPLQRLREGLRLRVFVRVDGWVDRWVGGWMNEIDGFDRPPKTNTKTNNTFNQRTETAYLLVLVRLGRQLPPGGAVFRLEALRQPLLAVQLPLQLLYPGLRRRRKLRAEGGRLLLLSSDWWLGGSCFEIKFTKAAGLVCPSALLLENYRHIPTHLLQRPHPPDHVRVALGQPPAQPAARPQQQRCLVFKF